MSPVFLYAWNYDAHTMHWSLSPSRRPSSPEDRAPSGKDLPVLGKTPFLTIAGASILLQTSSTAFKRRVLGLKYCRLVEVRGVQPKTFPNDWFRQSAPCPPPNKAKRKQTQKNEKRKQISTTCKKTTTKNWTKRKKLLPLGASIAASQYEPLEYIYILVYI